MNRVVVTGMGVVSPLGSEKEKFWNALKAGESGVGEIESFDAVDHTTKIAAEVKDFEPTEFFPKKEARRTDRFIQFASAAGQMAVQDAELEITDDNRQDVGVSIGSGIGGLGTFEESHKTLLEKGPRRVSPFFIPMMIANMASGKLSIELGAMGPNLTLVTACATATHSIGESYRILQRGDSKVMITGGAEATITPLAIAGFNSMKALSTRNDDPTKASRPFDSDRDGFVMGEGAGVLVLETLEHALERGADIYGEVVGFGMTGDAYHMTAPCPESKGAKACMEEAIRDSDLDKSEFQYINAHGTSTEYNDKFETLAVRDVFGEHADNLMISSTKSMTGHLLGAAGGVESIATLLSMRDNYIHPTINLENADPECDLDYVPQQGRPYQLSTALINNFGFGGTNACLVLKKYTE